MLSCADRSPYRGTGFWTTLLIVSDWAIRLVMLPIVPTRRSPEAAKGWLLFIFFLPWVGLLLYLLIGRPRLPRWRLQRRGQYIDLIEPVRRRMAALPQIAAPAVDPQYQPSVRLATDLGMLDNLGGNSVELLTDYNGTIDRIAADIDAARHHVHLCFYIFGDDERSGIVIAALGRAVARGVICRVLIDAFGSRPSRRTLLPKLHALGVAARVALPVRVGRKTARFDLRNHRKIVVIDGDIGYTGSQNMVSADFKPGLNYSELMVRIKGPSALQLQAVFGADWFVESGEFIGEAAFPVPVRAGRDAGAGASQWTVVFNSARVANGCQPDLFGDATSGRDDAVFHPKPVFAGCTGDCGASGCRGSPDRRRPYRSVFCRQCAAFVLRIPVARRRAEFMPTPRLSCTPSRCP